LFCLFFFFLNFSSYLQTTIEDLTKKFAECGDILEVVMPTNANGSFRGFGFVQFKDLTAATKVDK